MIRPALLAALAVVSLHPLAAAQAPAPDRAAPPERAAPATDPTPARAPAPTPAQDAVDPGLRDAWAFLAQRYDKDGDGQVTATEYTRGADAFARLDLDGDGALTAQDFAAPPPSAEALATRDAVGAQLVALLWLSPGDHRTLEPQALAENVAALDGNGDALLQRAEFDAHRRAPDAPFMPPMMATLLNGADPFTLLAGAADADADGALSAEELLAWFDSNDPASAGRWTADGLRKPCMMAIMNTVARPRARPGQDRMRTGDATAAAPPEIATVGAMAPDFTLGTEDARVLLTLSSFRGHRPVALIFGSYTCPPFRNGAAHLKQLFTTFGDRVQFLLVYIREAHALDGDWPITEQGMPLVEDPASLQERRLVAQQCTVALELGAMTAVVDDVDDSVNAAYDAAPDRLYLVARDGTVAYKGGPGPSGFDAGELEAAIRAELAKDGAPAAPPR